MTQRKYKIQLKAFEEAIIFTMHSGIYEYLSGFKFLSETEITIRSWLMNYVLNIFLSRCAS